MLQQPYSEVNAVVHAGFVQVHNKAVFDADDKTVQISVSRDRILNNRVTELQNGTASKQAEYRNVWRSSSVWVQVFT